MTIPVSFNGINRNKAVYWWRFFGGCVEEIRRTGEIRFLHPLFPQTITMNCRRKDCSRQVSQCLNRLRAQPLHG